MHEIGLVAAAAAALATETADRTVGTVTIAIGPRVDPEVAAVAWRQAVEATALAGAAVVWAPALDGLACFSCGHAYLGRALDRCPSCGGDGLVVAPAEEVAVTGWRPD